MATHQSNDSNTRRIRGLHTELALALHGEMTKEKVESLKFYFTSTGVFREPAAEKMTCMRDIWKELDRNGTIKPGDYFQLEAAFKACGTATRPHIATIRDFKENIKSEEQSSYENWIIDKRVIESKEKLERQIFLYQPQLNDGRSGIVFINAAIGLIGEKEGGEIRPWNGSATLEVPPKAVDGERILWIIRLSPTMQKGSEQFHCQSGTVDKTDGIVKYSLPVWLGPAEVKFSTSVLLTLTEFSLQDTTDGKAKRMAVYRKPSDNSTWEHVGSCFCKTDSHGLTMTAEVTINCFSSYILGIPAAESPLPVNTHIIVQTDDCTSGKKQLLVFFLINDFSYIKEFIEHNMITVDCETCLFLAADSDVIVTWRRKLPEESPQHTSVGILSKQSIQNLAEKTVLLEIDQPGKEGSEGLDDSMACDDVLILEQNGAVLLELPFNRKDVTIATASLDEKSQELDKFTANPSDRPLEEMDSATAVNSAVILKAGLSDLRLIMEKSSKQLMQNFKDLKDIRSDNLIWLSEALSNLAAKQLPSGSFIAGSAASIIAIGMIGVGSFILAIRVGSFILAPLTFGARLAVVTAACAASAGTAAVVELNILKREALGSNKKIWDELSKRLRNENNCTDYVNSAVKRLVWSVEELARNVGKVDTEKSWTILTMVKAATAIKEVKIPEDMPDQKQKLTDKLIEIAKDLKVNESNILNAEGSIKEMVDNIDDLVLTVVEQQAQFIATHIGH